MNTQIVWFKRDLRLEDHLPLAEAAQKGPCILLYVYEPELIQSQEFDVSHLEFINQSLKELDAACRRLGGWLTLRVGSMPQVLDELWQLTNFESLWSHEETGNAITYERDRRVGRWADANQVEWHEFPQNGVIRRLKSRDGWAKKRQAFLNQPLTPTPERVCVAENIDPGRIHTATDFELAPTCKTNLQPGGEAAAKTTLESFLSSRGRDYSQEMSSPVTARTACSRLSSYLSWGCISMKQVTHALKDRQLALRESKAEGTPVGNWLKSLRAFESRLSWHCHFMQKLEDEPAIEFENMSRAYDGLREEEFRDDFFAAWCTGQTGYPLVDACMRALLEGSWINFRMRAMLVSFASYHLWLHWRQPAVFLARHFLDFEPGIHFSQFQMQSGTTGINTVRIYSPIKQVKDQDPNGVFIREYVPELELVPTEYLAEPHKLPLSMQSKAGCLIGQDYPPPIVNHATAYRTARERIYAVRKLAATRDEAARVAKKHGSRKASGR